MSFFTTLLQVGLAAGLLVAAELPSAAQTTSPAPAATAATLKDGAFRRNGRVFRLQAGQSFPLAAPMQFSNGLTLRPNGIMISKNGTHQLLADGQAVNMQGDVVVYRDDMMTPTAIARRDQQVTGAAPTVVEIPPATNLAALNTALRQTAQRLDELRQLANLLAERASAAAAGSPPAPELEQKIQLLSQQLQR